ncbi:hypothetical protein, partial [Poseidonibacter ostreae]
MKLTKKIFFIYILSIVFIFLLTLFAYLFKIENNIKDYSIYKTHFLNLILSEKEFKNFFLQKNKFINFDKIVNETKNFEQTLSILNTSDLHKDFGDDFLKKLQIINSNYTKKLQLIEEYKSSQVTILNSMYYILDLNKSLQLDENYDLSLKTKINDIMFIML